MRYIRQTMDLEQYRTHNLIVPTDPTTLVFSKIRDSKLISKLSERIDVWTNGQPFLTYLIHHYLSQYSAQIVSSEGPAIIDEIVFQKIIKNWRKNEAATHLIAIEKAILAHPLKDELLILYMRFLWLETLPPEFSLPTQTQIQLNQSGERSLLLRTGLLKRNQGNLNQGNLAVANAIYTTIFSQDWLEAQLPGITRTVSVFSTLPDSTAAAEPSINHQQLSNQQSTAKKSSETFSSRLSDQQFTYQPVTQHLTQHLGSLKLFAVLCGVLLSIATLAHAQTISLNPAASVTDRTAKKDIQQNGLSDREPDQLSDRDLYDQGMNHAMNARWITALQKFCQIPSESVYFSLANQQLSQWVLLYPDELQKANDGLRLKKNRPCGLAEEALNAL